MNDAKNQIQPLHSTGDKAEPKSNGKPILHFWRCFWLSFLVISLGYAGYCFYVPPNKIAWVEGFAVAGMQAREKDKPIILYFTGEWCVPCRIMKRQVWADPQVMAKINEQFIPVEIDVGDRENASLLDRYNVKGSPVTIITDPSGNAKTWRAGGLGKSEFLDFLGEGLAHSTTES